RSDPTDKGDFAVEFAVDASELEAGRAATANDDALRQIRLSRRFVRGEDTLAVDRQTVNRSWSRASIDHDVLRANFSLLAILLDTDRAGTGDRSPTFDGVD